MKNQETGKLGETIACGYLKNKGYCILARNHKEKFDEIDIIARHPNGALIFCEVKTVNQNREFIDGFMPEDNLNQTKRRKMVRASAVFLARHRVFIQEGAGWQIDLIAIVLDKGKVFTLRHYENI